MQYAGSVDEPRLSLAPEHADESKIIVAACIAADILYSIYICVYMICFKRRQ